MALVAQRNTIGRGRIVGMDDRFSISDCLALQY